MEKISLRSIVQAVDDLPSLPHIATRVIELTDDPNSTAQSVNMILNQDPSMTAKVLRLANSAFYGFARRIPTVTEATVLLGFQTIRSIVIAASVSKILDQRMEGYALPPGELWKHSQTAAIASRLMARQIRFGNLELAYTAALLHDIGKVVLDRYMRESSSEVFRIMEEEKMSLYEAERAVLGFNHAMVGSRVLDNWDLPIELVEGVAWHHEPERSKGNQKLAALVHVADHICLTMGIGLGPNRDIMPLSPAAMTLLQLSEADIQDWVTRLETLLPDQEI